MQTGEKYLKPLFRKLLDKTKDNTQSTYFLMQAYMSTFVSAVLQYPEIGISAKELYICILNYKYLLNLFYCNIEELARVLDVCTFEWADIGIGKRDLLLEYFEYIRLDMRNELTVMGTMKIDPENDICQICFGIIRDGQNTKNYSVGILYNKAIEKIWEECSTEPAVISDYEKKMCDFLRSRIYGKDTIYVAIYSMLLPIPLAAVKISKDKYIGELFQIIYCSSGYDAGEDIVIEDFDNSIFLGVSKFENLNRKGKRRLV